MYLYEKLLDKNLDDFITYFDENYEKDKASARKEGQGQLWATLDMISIRMQTHQELFIKKFDKEKYEKLNIKGTGKTPLQFVEADLEELRANFRAMAAITSQQSHITYNFFSDPYSSLKEAPEELGEDLSDLESKSSETRYGSIPDQDSDSDTEECGDWCKRFWRKIC